MFGIFFIVLLVLGRENADENGQNEKISIELRRRDAQMFLRNLRRGLNGNPHARTYTCNHVYLVMVRHIVTKSVKYPYGISICICFEDCHVFREHIPVDYSYAANLPERALPTSDEYIRFVSKCRK